MQPASISHLAPSKYLEKMHFEDTSRAAQALDVGAVHELLGHLAPLDVLRHLATVRIENPGPYSSCLGEITCLHGSHDLYRCLLHNNISIYRQEYLYIHNVNMHVNRSPM